MRSSSTFLHLVSLRWVPVINWGKYTSLAPNQQISGLVYIIEMIIVVVIFESTLLWVHFFSFSLISRICVCIYIYSHTYVHNFECVQMYGYVYLNIFGRVANPTPLYIPFLSSIYSTLWLSTVTSYCVTTFIFWVICIKY